MEPTRQEVMDALHASSNRFIALVESLHPDDGSRPVPGLDWDVAETVTHVLTVVRRGFADRRRSQSAAETPALNQQCLEETPERDLSVLAAQLRADVHTALDLVFPRIAEDREFPFHGGVTTTLTPALRIVLGEYLVHGYDVATATGRPWTITASEAVLALPGELMSAWVRPDAEPETYELRLGLDPPIRFEVGPGRLRVTSGTGATVIAMDPVDLLLGFYNRIPVEDEGLARLQRSFIPS